MKRSELKIGETVTDKKYGGEYIVLALEPWIEHRTHYGRFGSVGSGRFNQVRPGVGVSGGVALASVRGQRSPDGPTYVPCVMQLSQLQPIADRDEQRAQAAIAQQARRDREASFGARLDALRAAAPALNVQASFSRFEHTMSTTQVVVSLEMLEQYLQGRRALPDFSVAEGLASA